MKNYLKSLAIEILKNCEGGLTKVKFAKVIYFIHKGLVCDNLAKNNDLGFIRMPLGPVPVGFMDLSRDMIFNITKIANNGPVYNSEVYKLNGNIKGFFSTEFSIKIEKLCAQLNRFSTSELVDKSHREPSWINNINGSRYFMNKEDLSIPLPINTRSISETEDNQKLQEKLIEGMLDDIVSGSTSLEYPDSGEK